VDESTLLVDHTQTIPIPVHPYAEFGSVIGYRLTQIYHILWPGGIRGVVWEGIVPIAEDWNHIDTKALQEPYGERSGNGIATIQSNPDVTSGFAYTLADFFDVPFFIILHYLAGAISLTEISRIECPSNAL
jgi:hypothetical protein